MTRKVFLDAGAHKATSIRAFQQWYPDWREWDIYSFEANNEYSQYFLDLPENIHYYNQAVWLYDGFVPFYNNHGGSSTIVQGKAIRGGFEKEIYIVPAINFSKWLDDNFDGSEHITAKFDLESAEYAVLRKMISDGTINKISKLYCEFHHHKTQGQVTGREHVELVEDLLKLNLPPFGWAAQDGDTTSVVPFHVKLGIGGNEHRALEGNPELYARSQRCIEIATEMIKKENKL